MARGIGRALIIFEIFIALLIIAILVITLREPSFATRPMPDPNGYEDLVKAAEMATKALSETTMGPGSNLLADAVAANAEALRVARIGLARECRLPPGTSPDEIKRPSFRFLVLVRAFEDEGTLADMRGQQTEAAHSYLAATRIGQEMTRGGAVMDAMIGSGFEEEGLTPLERLATTFTSDECKQVIAALDSADAKRETVANVVRQEKIWGKRRYGWRYYMHPIVNAQQKHRAGSIPVVSDRTRKLMITLAARTFELEHGAKPKSINDLVPNYLKTVPKDASMGKDMAYPP